MRPRPKRGHEVDGFGGDELGGERQVAFVLAVFIIDHDDHAAGLDLLDGAGTSMKGRWGIVLGAFLCCMKDAA